MSPDILVKLRSLSEETPCGKNFSNISVIQKQDWSTPTLFPLPPIPLPASRSGIPLGIPAIPAPTPGGIRSSLTINEKYWPNLRFNTFAPVGCWTVFSSPSLSLVRGDEAKKKPVIGLIKSRRDPSHAHCGSKSIAVDVETLSQAQVCLHHNQQICVGLPLQQQKLCVVLSYDTLPTTCLHTLIPEMAGSVLQAGK